MGKIYADSLEDPVSAMAVLGDFCFLAGKCNREFVLYHPGQDMRDFMIMVPQDKDWADLIEECYGEKAKRVARYAIKKEKDVFDREALQKAVDELPGGYTLKMIDEKLFWHCRKIAWCRDWVLYICGAKLILECLKREWYPSWDAQNKWSVSLAEKLGYHFAYEYTAYEVTYF